ncbi:MAG: AlpA family phage regulatory protein [Acinetobacter sp.]
MNEFTGQNFTMHQMINIKQVIAITGICRSTIYEMININSKYYDSTFPKPICLSITKSCSLN